MSDGYSLFKSGGSWFVRWSEWHDGKRTQPSKRLCSVRDYPKKGEVNDLAREQMRRVDKAPTLQAGASVNEFVTSKFFPDVEKRLAKTTVRLYRQMWKLLEPDLGHLRLRDVRVVDVQNALNGIYSTRGDELCHDVFMQTKVSASAIFAHALRLGHHPGPNPATGTSVRGYGHNNHRENGAYTLQEIKQFLALYPSGQVPSPSA
jgi:hypothetical protein